MKKINYYTGLKALACLIVSANHCLGAYMNMTIPKTKWYCIFYNGTFMVSLFIILSDFFFAYSILRSQTDVRGGISE